LSVGKEHILSLHWPYISLESFLFVKINLYFLAVGIPLIFYKFLKNNRLTLNSIDTKETLGFLYQGYNKKYYYWYEPI
jgi:hypothetical protein